MLLDCWGARTGSDQTFRTQTANRTTSYTPFAPGAARKANKRVAQPVLPRIRLPLRFSLSCPQTRSRSPWTSPSPLQCCSTVSSFRCSGWLGFPAYLEPSPSLRSHRRVRGTSGGALSIRAVPGAQRSGPKQDAGPGTRTRQPRPWHGSKAVSRLGRRRPLRRPFLVFASKRSIHGQLVQRGPSQTVPVPRAVSFPILPGPPQPHKEVCNLRASFKEQKLLQTAEGLSNRQPVHGRLRRVVTQGEDRDAKRRVAVAWRHLSPRSASSFS